MGDVAPTLRNPGVIKLLTLLYPFDCLGSVLSAGELIYSIIPLLIVTHFSCSNDSCRMVFHR